MTKTIIAMWSGPRNLSTAMMRSFESRKDTEVLDEPFYAHYLSVNELDHPGREAILNSQSTNWNDVASKCVDKNFSKRPIWYQKHMAQHNLKGFEINWIKDIQNCLLIRNPRSVIASYGKKSPITDERLLGYVQQAEIIDLLEDSNRETPPIIDADDILKNPESMLRELCKTLGIDFHSSMLSWQKGPRDSDGIWGPYWYDGVYQSTGFKPYIDNKIELDPDILGIYENCKKYYDDFHKKRIKP